MMKPHYVPMDEAIALAWGGSGETNANIALSDPEKIPYTPLIKRTKMEPKEFLSVLYPKIVGIIAFFLFAYQWAYCQKTDNASVLQLSFSSITPNRTKAVSPGDYILHGWPDAMRKAGEQYPPCLYGIDWISFRLTPPNKIDSIRISGDFLPEYFTDHLESRILASQPFWQYVDSEKIGSIVIRLAVEFYYESGCHGQRPSAKYLAESAALDSLSKTRKRVLQQIKAVRQSQRLILLWPVYLQSVR